MTITTTIRVTLATLLVACGFATAALAAGEPKNDYPFTRHVATERTPALAQSTAQTAGVAGEPKNEWPFTRSAGGASAAALASPALGEAKNDVPFNEPIVVSGAIGTGSDGFQWGDAGIGLAAGFGLAVALAGLLLLTIHRIPRMRKTGAAAAG
jgi:hypothetical protein